MVKEVKHSEVVRVLCDEYSVWIAMLDKDEKRAIRKYTYNSMDKKNNRFFERLNSMLRGDYNKSDKEMLAKYADVISGALSKHKLEHCIICYRGMDTDPTAGVINGTIFSFDQFTSTSVIRSKALNRRYLYIIRIPKGACGAYVEGISAFPRQREFLLDKSCKYKLLRRTETVIELEVVI